MYRMSVSNNQSLTKLTSCFEIIFPVNGKSWLSCFGPQGKEKLSARFWKTFRWIRSRDTSREIRFSFKARNDNATSFLPSFLPSVKWIHLFVSFYFHNAHTYACIHLHTFQSWHLYTWFHFSSGKSHGISSSLIFITTSRGKKRDTLNNIDDEDPRRSFTWLTSCIKVGLIGWNIYTDIY